MKYTILLLITLFIFSCGDSNTAKKVSTETIYPSDQSFLDSASEIQITLGTENFWKPSNNKELIVESKIIDFEQPGSYELPKVNLERYQIMQELLDIDRNVIARGITSIIDTNNLKSVYKIFLIPINQAITLLFSEMGVKGGDSISFKNLKGHTVTALPNGKVLIWGGYDDANGYNSKVLVYSPEDLTTEVINSNIPRAYHTATIYYLNNKDPKNPKDPRVLISGGINENGNDIETAEIYNPKDNSIETLKAQPVSKGINQSSIFGRNGFVYLFGGKYHSDTGDEKYSNAILSFNPISKTFSTLITLPKALENTTASNIGEGNIIIAGGNDDNNVSKSIYLFNYNNTTITPLGELESPRTKHTSIVNGSELYLIGGYSEHHGDTFSSPVGAIEKITKLGLDTNFNCTMDIARGDAAINQVKAKDIIISGGNNGDNTPIKKSTVIEFMSNACNEVKSIELNYPRNGAKSVLTQNGLTLIIGGVSNNDNGTSFMEILSVVP